MGVTGALFAAQTVLTGVSTYSQSRGIKAQGEYQAQQAAQNANLATLQSEDAITRGKRDVSAHKQQVRKLIGSQRAALAAQGVDVNYGSALDVQEDTAALGALDELTISNNAWRESFGYRVQATDYGFQGQFAKLAARNEARNTLLTGGAQIVNSGLTTWGTGSRPKISTTKPASWPKRP